MADNVFHSRRRSPYDDESALCLDSHDRGPKGATGDIGPQGEPGISVVSMELDAKEHIIVTFSDKRKQDLGEIPKIVSQRVFTTSIDGKSNTIPLISNNKVVEIEPERISFILLNGVIYTEGFEVIGDNLVLNIGKVPAGKLEIFTLSHGVITGGGSVTSVNGQIGDVRIATISDVDIENIVNGKDEL